MLFRATQRLLLRYPASLHILRKTRTLVNSRCAFFFSKDKTSTAKTTFSTQAESSKEKSEDSSDTKDDKKEEEKEEEPLTWKEELREVYISLCLTAQLLIVWYLSEKYVFKIIGVSGPSMLPTFDQSDNLVIVDKITPMIRGIKKGDIVISENPNKQDHTLCKRVIFTENETAVFKPPGSNVERSVLVPQNHVWIEGDNKSNSRDSRSFGPVSVGIIEGVVWYRVWPLSKWGKVY